jgi:hypothetical protein
MIKYKNYVARLEVVMAVKNHVMVFWVVTLYSETVGCRHEDEHGIVL